MFVVVVVFFVVFCCCFLCCIGGKCCSTGHREPIVTGLLIGAKKCKEARGSYFVQGDL